MEHIVPKQLNLKLDPPDLSAIRMMSVDEIWSKLNEIRPVDMKEDNRIERKVAGVTARTLGDYCSVFANTAPDGGIILVGVEDDGSISGCNGTPLSHMNELQRAGDVFCPDARYENKIIKMANRKGEPDTILALRINYRADKLVETTSCEAFIRRGSSKRKLSDEEKRDLRNTKGQLELEREPVNLRYPDDFRPDLIRQFVTAVRDERRALADRSEEEILVLRHLATTTRGRIVPNLACALLFAKDPTAIVPGCRIRFLRYDGVVEKTGEDYNAIKSEWIEGTVPELIVNAEKIIDTQVRDFSRLGKDNKFYSFPEYPKAAWYEAIVNACVHRSYAMKGMNIFVKMFDDKLVIESPGGFPPFVTPENIYDMHQPRNPHLMDAMYYMKFVQCAHEGTRRIRDYMEKSGLPAPVFSQKELGNVLVQVILKNDAEHRRIYVDSQAYRVLGATLSKALNENEKRIINFVAENRTINVTQTGNIINRRWQFCKKLLTGLVDRGILDHFHDPKIERDRNQYYTLKKKFSDKIEAP